MNRDTHWRIVIFGLIIGIVGGFIARLFVSLDFSIVIGFLIWIMVEMVYLRVDWEKLRVQYRSMSTLLEFIRSTDKFTELTLLYGLKSGKFSPSSVKVERSQFWYFWRDCIARATSSWVVLSYTDPAETWVGTWEDLINSIQRERIETGCAIRRIYIVDSEEEEKGLAEIAERQRRIGARIDFIAKSELLKNSSVQEFYQKLGTLDVAVVDGSWAYLTHLDEKRQITGASAIKDRELLEKASLMVQAAEGMISQKRKAS